VIFGGGFGSYEMYALDEATGTLRWQVHTRDDGPTAAVVADGAALFNTESCTLMAVDAATGAPLWEKWLGDPLLAQPAAGDGRVVMVYPRGGKHWLGAFDIRSGGQLWETETGHDVITAPVIADGHVYMSTYDGAVSCIDAATGHLRWTRPMQATSAPFIFDGQVYVAKREAGDAAPSEPSSARAPAGTREHTSWVHAHSGVDAGASFAKEASYLSAAWGRSRQPAPVRDRHPTRCSICGVNQRTPH
jgi:outer membrane protein assembly factor BamB